MNDEDPTALRNPGAGIPPATAAAAAIERAGPVPPAPIAAASVVLPETGRGELMRYIWALAWPVVATLTLESLVGLADMLMVGRLGTNAVAAVGIGVQILMAVNAAMFAIGTGTLAIVARHVGAREVPEAEHVLAQSVIAAFALSVATILPVLAFAPEILGAFGVDPAVVTAGTPYLRLVMLGVPADAIFFVTAMGLRGAGDTKTPLAIAAAVGIVNVIGNYVLMFGKLGLPALGVTGAAGGTVLAFACGATLALALVGRGGLVLRVPARGLRPDLPTIRRILRIGGPAAAEHLLMHVGFALYVIFAARYGTAAVAAYMIGIRILALSFLPGVGFAAAAGTLVGQRLGAGHPDHAAESGWGSTRLALYIMTPAGIGIYAAARPIARLFVDDPEVVAATVSFIHVLAAAQPLMATDFTLGGALRGAGDTRFPLLSMLAGFYVCRLGTAYAVTFWLGLDLVWLWAALIGDYAVRSFLKVQRFRSDAWHTIGV